MVKNNYMQVAFYTDPGARRSENQDYVGAFTNQVGRVMVMVADGVTSTEGGDVASAMAVEHFGNAWTKTTIETIAPINDWLRKMTSLENDAILQAGERFDDLKKMATTFVLAVLFDDQVVIGNLGDSKAFLLHDDQLAQLSFDHNLENEMWRTGKVFDQKSQNSENAKSLTRFLGFDRRADIEISQRDFVADDMLFLTSDGIPKVVEATKVKEVMREQTSLDDRSCKLSQGADANGAPDNVTALLVSRDNKKETK